MKPLLRLSFALFLVSACVVAAQNVAAPMTLTDPNGQDLLLERLDVRVAAHGPLALTEIELRFRNPQDVQVEGRFQCILPPGATVSRFAKEVGSKLVEGEVVEKQRATRIYTEILHTLRDPALLTQDKGNRFQARIFPIPARGTTRLLLSWSSVAMAGADGVRRVTVPLRGLPRVQELAVRAVARGFPGEALEVSSWLGATVPEPVNGEVLLRHEDLRQDVLPPADLVLGFRPGPRAATTEALVAGQYVMLRHAPSLPETPSFSEPASWEVWVDTSASLAAAEEHRVLAVGAFVGALATNASKGTPVRVLGFDQEFAPVLEATSEKLANEAIEAGLRDRSFLGATNLGRALTEIGARARKDAARQVFVLVTDGIPTLGPEDLAGLLAALGEVPENDQLHVVVVGSNYDAPLCEALTSHGRGRVATIAIATTFREKAKEVAVQLRTPIGAEVHIAASGVQWAEPQVFRDVLPGSELVTFARLEDNATGKFGVSVSGATTQPLTVAPRVVPEFATLLERLALRAQLDLLDRQVGEAEDPEAKKKLQARMVELSVRHRVLCRLTAMLVLESERDYARFGIDRTALANIMRVGPAGIETIQRSLAPAEVEALKAVRKANQATEAEPQEQHERHRETTPVEVNGEPNQTTVPSDPISPVPEPKTYALLFVAFLFLVRESSRDGSVSAEG